MSNANPVEEAKEIQQMLVTYARQETVEPLKSLGRYLGFGISGAFLASLGTLFLGLGVLRLAQSRVSAFSGGSFASTLPYLITLAVLIPVMALLYNGYSRARKKVQS